MPGSQDHANRVAREFMYNLKSRLMEFDANTQGLGSRDARLFGTSSPKVQEANLECACAPHAKSGHPTKLCFTLGCRT